MRRTVNWYHFLRSEKRPQHGVCVAKKAGVFVFEETPLRKHVSFCLPQLSFAYALRTLRTKGGEQKKIGLCVFFVGSLISVGLEFPLVKAEWLH